MAVVTSPAWNLPSGQHLVIAQPAREPHPHATTPRVVVWLGIAASALALTSLAVYPLAAFGLNAHRGVLSLLTWLMSAGAVVAALTLIAAVTARAVCGHVDRRHEELYQRLARKVTGRGMEEEQRDRAILAALANTADLPEELRGRVDRAGAAYAAMVGQILNGQAELGERVLVAVEELRQRLEAVERDRAELQNLLRQQVATNRDLLVQVERLAKEHTGFAQLVLDQLQRIEPVAGLPAERVNGEQPAEEVGGELVPMPNSRAFKLGREVERRRWERHNGDS